jgi:glucosamine-6-phosphate deaminase
VAEIPVRVFPDAETAGEVLAGEVAALIRGKGATGEMAVLGLATGNTPLPFYRHLVRMHRHGLSLRNVASFNLDEYLGLPPEDPQSYRSFMQRHLFDHVDVAPENIHIPRGDLPEAELAAECADYEGAIRKAGGLDFQLLGIGRTGHIGFNEPGSPPESRTRVVGLDPSTLEDAAGNFGSIDAVPRRAVTMGCATILEARRIVLLAFGVRKAAIVRAALRGPVTKEIPASLLQRHGNVEFFLDAGAASGLGEEAG